MQLKQYALMVVVGFLAFMVGKYVGEDIGRYKVEQEIKLSDLKNDKKRDEIDADVEKLDGYNRCRKLGGMHDPCWKLFRLEATP